MVVAENKDAHTAGLQDLGILPGCEPPNPPQPCSFFPLKDPSLDWLPLQTMTGPHNGSRRPGASLL